MGFGHTRSWDDGKTSQVVREAAPAAVVACTAWGGSPVAGAERRALRLGTNEKEGGGWILTTHRRFGGRGNDEADDGGRDRRRRPVPMGGGGELGLAQKRRQGGG
jgi:hypothetical protein